MPKIWRASAALALIALALTGCVESQPESAPKELGQTGQTCDSLEGLLEASEQSVAIGVSSAQRDVDHYKDQLDYWDC
jgi:hypothetical protein